MEDLANIYKRGNKVKIHNSGEKGEDTRGCLGKEVAEGKTTFIREGTLAVDCFF